jgi:hypothetical protein
MIDGGYPGRAADLKFDFSSGPDKPGYRRVREGGGA